MRGGAKARSSQPYGWEAGERSRRGFILLAALGLTAVLLVVCLSLSSDSVAGGDDDGPAAEPNSAPLTYTIAVTVTSGTGTGSFPVEKGSSIAVNYKADADLVLASVTVDGEKVDVTSCPDSYLFSNVMDNHTVEVIYLPAITVTIHIPGKDNQQVILASQDGTYTYYCEYETTAAGVKDFKSYVCALLS